MAEKQTKFIFVTGGEMCIRDRCLQWVQCFRRPFVLENFTAFAGLRRLCSAL